VKDYPVPKNIREIRGWLGLAGYYRRFVENFAEIAQPLSQLTKKGIPFVWGSKQMQSFEKLKKVLCSNQVLIFPDFHKEFIVSTDASGTAVGAILSQNTEDGERPVAYASRQLNAAERNYSTTERELLAVIFATKQFRCYLLGKKFQLITDHAALKWMLSLRDPSSRLTRWALRLSEFDYEVVHKPGRKHTNADALSRAVMLVEAEEINEDILIQHQKDDPWCQKILSSGTGRKEREIILWTDGEEDQHRWKIAMPSRLAEKAIAWNHCAPWAGHPGQERTASLVKKRYYWPKLGEAVKKFVLECH